MSRNEKSLEDPAAQGCGMADGTANMDGNKAIRPEEEQVGARIPRFRRSPSRTESATKTKSSNTFTISTRDGE